MNRVGMLQFGHGGDAVENRSRWNCMEGNHLSHPLRAVGM